MQVVIAPRRAVIEVDRLVVYLSAEEITDLVWEGRVQVKLRDGPVVRVMVQDEREADKPAVLV